MSNDEPDIDKIFEEATEVTKALCRAARQAMIEHKLLGFPIAGWRDGKVVWIPPEEIEIPEIPD